MPVVISHGRRRFLAAAPFAWAAAVSSPFSTAAAQQGPAAVINAGAAGESAVPTEQPGLVLSHGPAGWWDSQQIGSPQVMRSSDGTWKMWYYGRDPSFEQRIRFASGRSGLATSADGVHWERVRGPLTMGSVFEPSPDEKRFDSAHVGVTDVQLIDGVYWMWYLGGDHTFVGGDNAIMGLRMRSGCAISRDGINWTRVDGPYDGALLDFGKPGEFDALYVGFPKVLRDASDWKLYYHSFGEGKFRIGMAVSPDGLRWQKVGQILGPGEPGSFDELGVGSRHVMRVGQQYLMFFHGINRKGNFAVGLATSDDGLHWRKDAGDQPGGPVFTRAPDGSGRWDALGVAMPFVVPMPDGSFRMYYLGVSQEGPGKPPQFGIGLAVSEGSNFRKWHRWGA